MHDLGRLKDRPTAEWVPAPLDTTPVHKVDRTAQYLFQFVLHIDMVEEAPLRVRRESRQDVNVAVGSEVIAQDRPKKRQFSYLPPPAEAG